MFWILCQANTGKVFLIWSLLMFKLQGFLAVSPHSNSPNVQEPVFLCPVKGHPRSPLWADSAHSPCNRKAFCWTGCYWCASSSTAMCRISKAGVHLQATECKIHFIHIAFKVKVKGIHTRHFSHLFIHIFHGFLYTSSMC